MHITVQNNIWHQLYNTFKFTNKFIFLECTMDNHWCPPSPQQPEKRSFFHQPDNTRTKLPHDSRACSLLKLLESDKIFNGPITYAPSMQRIWHSSKVRDSSIVSTGWPPSMNPQSNWAKPEQAIEESQVRHPLKIYDVYSPRNFSHRSGRLIV